MLWLLNNITSFVTKDYDDKTNKAVIKGPLSHVMYKLLFNIKCNIINLEDNRTYNNTYSWLQPQSVFDQCYFRLAGFRVIVAEDDCFIIPHVDNILLPPHNVWYN